MNSYYYLSDSQVKSLLNALKNSRDSTVQETLNDISFQYEKSKSVDETHKANAVKKLAKIDSKSCLNEDLMVDSDGIVSQSSTGAYVQCWVWVDNEVKTRKTRKRATQ